MIGKTILHYKVLDKLGQGGMGVVYKAEDTKLKRTVALKFLPPHVLASDEERGRFVHEAQAAAALHHPNICTIYEINEAEDETFISMAYLEGRPLNERIEAGGLDPAKIVSIAAQIAKGLQAAHAKGIVHRDIKSSNIMIADDGRATIMDFGLAKSARQSLHTKLGTTLGTIAYMSPEQSRGDGVGPQTDIWSLGVIIYEMVTGKRPFRGDYDEAVIYSILNEEPQPISELREDAPPHLAYVIERAMKKNPADRYESAAEMIEDLELLQEEMGTSTASRSAARSRRFQVSQEPLPKRIFAPRVVGIVAIYLIAALLGIKLVDWLVNRFVLSPHLVNIVVVALLSMVPTVWILATRRSGSAVPSWSKAAKIGIPVNIVASLILMLVLFSGRDLGAATETVAVQDETGETIQRVVPKGEFRKSIAPFSIDNKSGDASYDWAQTGIPLLFVLDLYQEQFLYVRSGFDPRFIAKLNEAGFSNWNEAPWSLKRKIAEESNIDYLLTGSFTVEDGVWVMTLRVDDSRSGKLVEESEFRGTDLFAIVDEAVVHVKHVLDLPDHYIETSQDFPVSGMATSSMEAFEQFSEGARLAIFEQEWEGSVAALESAVTTDSTFTYAHNLLSQLYRATNRSEDSDRAVRATMRHLYKLPELIQFLIKVTYYGHTKEPDKQLAVAQMLVDLYPGSTDGHDILADLYEVRTENEKAIEQLEEILAIDPSRTEVLEDVAAIYNRMGDFDNAQKYLEAYVEAQPRDTDALRSIGGFHESHGQYEKARNYYSKALLIDPNKVSVLVEMADIDGELGDDVLALESYDSALKLANNPRERTRIHRALQRFYATRGQMEKSIEQLELAWLEQAKFQPPVNVQIAMLEEMVYFARAHRQDEAFAMIDSLAAVMEPPFDDLVSMGYIGVYTELEEADKAAEALKGLISFIDNFGYEVFREEVFGLEGDIAEIREDYAAAIVSFEKQLERDPRRVLANRSIGRCHRKLDQVEQAKDHLEEVLEIHPNDPETHYEMALVYYAMGEHDRAIEHLKKALNVWQDADPNFEPAKKAREKLTEWGST